MKTVTIAAVVSLTLGIVLANDDEIRIKTIPISDLDELQGTWVGSEVGREGQAVLVFSGKLIYFKGASPQEWYAGRGVMNEGESPKQADFLIDECGVPDFIGKWSRGIYKLDNEGILTLAGSMPGSEERPQKFIPGNGVRVFLFRKASSSIERPGFAGMDNGFSSIALRFL